MAKLVSPKCPQCGAPVSVPPEATQIVCGYCQHRATVQRGGSAPKRTHHGQIDVSVIHIPHQRKLGCLGIGLLFLMIGGPLIGIIAGVVAPIYATNQMTKKTMTGLTDLTSLAGLPGSGGGLSFSDHPFLFDVNGDGVADVIGKSQALGGSQSWLVALDGRSGKELWRSNALPEDATDSSAIRGLAGSVFISVDSLGKVQAYQAKTGQPAWAALLGEKARQMCHGDSFVRITTDDRQSHELSLTNGQKLSDKSKAPCASMPVSRSDGGIGYRMASWSEYGALGLPSLHAIEGMRADRAIVPDGGKRAFLLGSRSPGSQVSMLAAVEGKKVLWKTLVPAVDPLTTDVNVTTQIGAWAGQRVVVPYQLKGSKGMRMAAFDTKTGTREWDVPIHDKSQVETGIAMTERDIYYASWTTLYVLAADTGELRFKVGREM